MPHSAQPIFWRSAELPFVELRYIADGHSVRYTPHSHEQWSIGAILNGQSSFLCGDRLHQVQQGDLVIMNAHEVHACNPAPDSPWSYYMLHVDCDWLGQMLYQAGLQHSPQWLPTTQDVVSTPETFQALKSLCDLLMSNVSAKQKATALATTLSIVFAPLLSNENTPRPEIPSTLSRIAYYLIEHAHQDEAIEDIAAKFGLSSSYLSRQFKRYYQMTPHAFRLNRRIQLGQIALKNGVSIVEVAGQFGFSDQAHFHRVFKQRVAATPKQYTATGAAF